MQCGFPDKTIRVTLDLVPCCSFLVMIDFDILDRGETYLEKNLDVSVFRYNASAADAPDQKTIDRYLTIKPTISDAIGFIPEVC